MDSNAGAGPNLKSDRLRRGLLSLDLCRSLSLSHDEYGALERTNARNELHDRAHAILAKLPGLMFVAGDALVDLRTESRLTYVQAANAIGATRSAYFAIERGLASQPLVELARERFPLARRALKDPDAYGRPLRSLLRTSGGGCGHLVDGHLLLVERKARSLTLQVAAERLQTVKTALAWAERTCGPSVLLERLRNIRKTTPTFTDSEIRSRREQANLSLSALSKLTGVSKTGLHRAERGGAIPPCLALWLHAP